MSGVMASDERSGDEGEAEGDRGEGAEPGEG